MNELAKSKTEIELKYIYYVLSIAGALIAFAAHITIGLAISFSQIPLGVSVICWMLSFYKGCSVIDNEIEFNGLNWKFMSLNHPDPNVAFTENTSKNRKEAQDLLWEIGKKQRKNCIWQFRLLILGAGMFIVWRILEMCLLPINLEPLPKI